MYIHRHQFGCCKPPFWPALQGSMLCSVTTQSECSLHHMHTKLHSGALHTYLHWSPTVHSSRGAAHGVAGALVPALPHPHPHLPCNVIHTRRCSGRGRSSGCRKIVRTESIGAYSSVCLQIKLCGFCMSTVTYLSGERCNGSLGGVMHRCCSVVSMGITSREWPSSDWLVSNSRRVKFVR